MHANKNRAQWLSGQPVKGRQLANACVRLPHCMRPHTCSAHDFAPTRPPRANTEAGARTTSTGGAQLLKRDATLFERDATLPLTAMHRLIEAFSTADLTSHMEVYTPRPSSACVPCLQRSSHTYGRRAAERRTRSCNAISPRFGATSSHQTSCSQRSHSCARRACVRRH